MDFCRKDFQKEDLHYLPTKICRIKERYTGGYFMSKLVLYLLDTIEDITQTSEEGNVQMAEDLKHDANA
jgi:hypothetical protein